MIYSLGSGGWLVLRIIINIRPREDKYAQIRKDIIRIFNRNKGRYGYRRVYNHKTVAKLMVEMGLYARKLKLRYHSYKGEVGKIAPNVLQRDFATDAPNRKWTTDVSLVDIGGKKCYISPILDMWNGEIISYVISDRPDLKMVVDMCRKRSVNIRILMV